VKLAHHYKILEFNYYLYEPHLTAKFICGFASVLDRMHGYHMHMCMHTFINAVFNVTGNEKYLIIGTTEFLALTISCNMEFGQHIITKFIQIRHLVFESHIFCTS
jgi:hypothetical protein